MIVRVKAVRNSNITKSGKYISQVIVDDGSDTDERLVKVFSEKALDVKENDLVVLNESEDGKMLFYRHEYRTSSKGAAPARAVA